MAVVGTFEVPVGCGLDGVESTFGQREEPAVFRAKKLSGAMFGFGVFTESDLCAVGEVINLFHICIAGEF